MSALRQALADYLAVRRILGYRLARAEKLLAQFLTFIEGRGEEHLTIQSAIAWATAPENADPSWQSCRLSNVRRFALHLRGIDPDTEVPPTNILPCRSHRATPYLYSAEEISALMAATTILRGSHRQATYRTLIGLLAATGMRIGEAIRLDQHDFDSDSAVITIRQGKFGKSRELPLHSSVVAALSDYLHRADRPRKLAKASAIFLSPTGTQLLYVNVQNTFQRLLHDVGITPRSATCRPRLHDLRHGFAVNTILDAYNEGNDAGARLAILSTYLGHLNPANTYWYLSASPELLNLVGDRLERHLGGAA